MLDGPSIEVRAHGFGREMYVWSPGVFFRQAEYGTIILVTALKPIRCTPF